jgi:membrane-bound inhibitor of C-type lysozyme
MRFHRLIAATFSLTVAACATSSPDHADTQAASKWINYACSDGQVVKASYPDTNSALVIIKGNTHTLHIAISADGARYTGDGWQWWTKGMHDGMLAPLAAGENIASAQGVTCHTD